jgi:hypothetical protein
VAIPSIFDSNSSSSADGGPARWKIPSGHISGGSMRPDEFREPGQVLSTFYQEGMHGGLGRKFRRKVPLFQVRRWQ